MFLYSRPTSRWQWHDQWYTDVPRTHQSQKHIPLLRPKSVLFLFCGPKTLWKQTTPTPRLLRCLIFLNEYVLLLKTLWGLSEPHSLFGHCSLTPWETRPTEQWLRTAHTAEHARWPRQRTRSTDEAGEDTLVRVTVWKKQGESSVHSMLSSLQKFNLKGRMATWGRLCLWEQGCVGTLYSAHFAVNLKLL